MRTLDKNKTRMWYALHRESEVIYKLDEHGNKIFQKASDLKIPVEKYVEDNANKFKDFISM